MTMQSLSWSPCALAPGRGVPEGLPPQPAPFDPATANLKDELSGMHRQLDQLMLGQSALRPLLERVDQLVEGQVSMQLSLGLLQECVGGPRPFPPKCTEQNGIVPEKTADLAVTGTNEKGEFLDDALKLAKPKSAFALRADNRRQGRLKRIFEVGETDADLEMEASKLTFLARFKKSSALQTDILDSVALTMIMLNVMVMGFRIDDEENEDVYVKFDVLFALVFVFELVVRLRMHGVRGQFCGNDKIPKIFDALIIVVDAIHVTLELMNTPLSDSKISASLFRIVRLGRFIRLIRVLKTNMFADLLGMMQGIVGGLHTLIWAGILFVMMMYIAALICRETLGRSMHEHVHDYFNTVPRSMLTIFRCSFGDCSASGGVPIFEHVQTHYGGLYSLMYCLFVFSVTIGLFNVISAIFVDGAMAAAAASNEKRKQACLASETLMSDNVSALIRLVVETHPDIGDIPKMSDDAAMEEILKLEVDRAVLDQVVDDPRAVDALNNLDIDPHDHDKLSDIFDPDHGGTIGVLDLVNGLQRLRGDPRRSDIISVNLMIRSLQDKVEDLLYRVVHLKD